jgi:hypothetical protein
MYVRGYLQGSENGRVVTIEANIRTIVTTRPFSPCIRGLLQGSENGRVVTIDISLITLLSTPLTGTTIEVSIGIPLFIYFYY